MVGRSWRDHRLFGALAIVGAGTTAVHVCQLYNDPDRQAAQNLLKSSVNLSVPPSMFVDRGSVTETLQNYLNSPAGAHYAVVVGPRGSGKLTAVQAAVQGRSGVVNIIVREQDSALSALKGHLGLNQSSITDDEHICNVMHRAADMLVDPSEGTNASWCPTLICEIDTQSGQEAADTMIQATANRFKTLCADRRTARVILVLDDAYAYFSLPTDRARQHIVWVDDFSEDDAHDYFDKCNFLMPCDEDSPDPNEPNMLKRQELFETLGTRIATLESASRLGVGGKGGSIPDEELHARLDTFMSSERLAAKSELRWLLRAKSGDQIEEHMDFERLILDLLSTTDEIGVPEERTEDYLGRPAVASKAFSQKGMRAVLFHLPTRTYRFYSPAHRRAAEEWLATKFW